jgi:predicted AlkP superfamily phosphohydrolase/phosphomutase
MTLIALALDGLDECMFALPELNTIATLFRERKGGSLASTLPYITPVAFASMQTGVDPSAHGISYFFKNVNPFFNAPIKFYTSADIRIKTFYEILHDNKKKCFVMGLPFSYPSKISGDVVFDWFAGKKEVGSLVHPSDLLNEFPAIKDLIAFPEDSVSLQTKITNIYRSAKSISDIILKVVQSHKYDFCFFYMGTPDQLAHAVLHELLDNEKKDYLRIARDALSVVDNTVKGIINELRSQDDLMIFSDHGHHVYEKVLNVNNWLEENGYLVYGDNNSASRVDSSHVFRNLHSMINSDGSMETRPQRVVVPKWAGDAVRQSATLRKVALPMRRMLEKKLGTSIVDEKSIDVDRSLAATAGPLAGSIYINPKLPEAKRKAVRNEIIKKISSINGIDAYASDTVYKENVAGMYDISDVLLDSSKYDFGKFGVSSIVDSRGPNHRRKGVIILIGDSFNGQAPQNASLLDLMPTILHLMGSPAPEGTIHGRVLSEALSRKSIEPHVSSVNAS